ncbi:MAG TPA: ABC transporter C-terminal domain-containing protein, partial [Acidimicrobiales bacterium]|nr:ABC transporter C-terminal domain-containing protein [Acidimicrobiales bacterium]
YAIFEGRLRHLPGGVDEYLALRRTAGASPSLPAPLAPADETAAERARPGLSGGDRRSLQKEVTSIERRIDKRTAAVHTLHQRMASHDHTDHAGMRRLDEQLRAVEAETAELEERWLELSEQLG